jgi:hypothetical protein
MIPRLLFRSWLSLGIISLALVANCFGQESTAAVPSKPEVILTKLFSPPYPPVAKAAHITGDVEITVNIRADGTVESADAMTGPPLLIAAALQSARLSTFQCRNCTGAVTPYHVLYSFKLELSECGTSAPLPSQPKAADSVTRIPATARIHVTITDTVLCIVDPVTIVTKPRTWKCLYLWHCGH